MKLTDFAILRLPRPPLRVAALAGLGGCLAIATLALIEQTVNMPLLAAAFGASCVLVFLAPNLPYSQPANVVGGHVVATLCGLVCAQVFPTTWWSLGLAVGLAIGAMALLRVTHPPAGGNPILVMTAHVGWSFLLLPMFVGAIAVVVVGLAFHAATRSRYPDAGENVGVTVR